MLHCPSMLQAVPSIELYVGHESVWAAALPPQNALPVGVSLTAREASNPQSTGKQQEVRITLLHGLTNAWPGAISPLKPFACVLLIHCRCSTMVVLFSLLDSSIASILRTTKWRVYENVREKQSPSANVLKNSACTRPCLLMHEHVFQ